MDRKIDNYFDLRKEILDNFDYDFDISCTVIKDYRGYPWDIRGKQLILKERQCVYSVNIDDLILQNKDKRFTGVFFDDLIQYGESNAIFCILDNNIRNENLIFEDTKKRYLHDCKTCVFLGTFNEFDLYVHPTSPKTLIARFSSDGPDYISGVYFTKPQNGEIVQGSEPLIEARRLAKEKGYVFND